MHRSSHLMDRSIASLILSASGDVVAMTSSSCMMMSEPMVFWREIECSGVSNLEAVNQKEGDREELGRSFTLGFRRADSRSVHPLR